MARGTAGTGRRHLLFDFARTAVSSSPTPPPSPCVRTCPSSVATIVIPIGEMPPVPAPRCTSSRAAGQFCVSIADQAPLRPSRSVAVGMNPEDAVRVVVVSRADGVEDLI